MTSSAITPTSSDAFNPVVVSLWNDALQAAVPDAQVTGSEWANTYRYISQGPRRGQKWSMETVPYFIEPLDCITDARVEQIVFWSGSRVAKTEALLLNATGYFMHMDPRPIMHLRPSLDDAKLFSRERFSAFIEETPVLRRLIADPRTRDSDNTMFYKKFLGGNVYFAGGNSPTGLLAQDFSILCADEIDALPVTAGAYGDPIDLSIVRLRNYRKDDYALSLLTSSPTIKGESRIEAAYELSDQRRYFVPCLGCGEYQELLWSSIVWSELGLAPKDACFLCPLCEHVGPEDEKTEMILNGEWRAHAEFNGVAGFKLLGTYSPWISWGEMAVEMLAAKKAKSYEKYQVWCNSTLGELYVVGEGIDDPEFDLPREDYDARMKVPEGVVFITFGVDIQEDRVEVEMVGWGLGDENWSIDYKVILGNPGEYPSPVWDELEDYLETEWPHELGVTMTATAGAIDTGHATDEAYKFCHKHRRKRWFAIKGASVAARPIAPRKYSMVGTPEVKLYLVGTVAAKDKAAAMFRVSRDPEGGASPRYCHIPKRYDEDWGKQICSEQRVRTTNKKGFRVWTWIVHPAGARNEAWDCRVYNIAAKEILNPNTPKLRERLLAKAAAVRAAGPVRERGLSGSSTPPPTPNKPPQADKPFRIPRRRGGFVGNW